MGDLYSFPTGGPVGPNLDELSSEEIWNRWRDSCDNQESTEEGQQLRRAWHRARVREADAAINGLPDEALITTQAVCGYLNVTGTAVLGWIYKGLLSGTKRPRGPRSFVWVVPVAEVRRLRLEQDERITRERAWMQEPESLNAEQFGRAWGRALTRESEED